VRGGWPRPPPASCRAGPNTLDRGIHRDRVAPRDQSYWRIAFGFSLPEEPSQEDFAPASGAGHRVLREPRRPWPGARAQPAHQGRHRDLGWLRRGIAPTTASHPSKESVFYKDHGTSDLRHRRLREVARRVRVAATREASTSCGRGRRLRAGIRRLRKLNRRRSSSTTGPGGATRSRWMPRSRVFRTCAARSWRGRGHPLALFRPLRPDPGRPDQQGRAVDLHHLRRRGGQRSFKAGKVDAAVVLVSRRLHSRRAERSAPTSWLPPGRPAT